MPNLYWFLWARVVSCLEHKNSGLSAPGSSWHCLWRTGLDSWFRNLVPSLWPVQLVKRMLLPVLLHQGGHGHMGTRDWPIVKSESVQKIESRVLWALCCALHTMVTPSTCVKQRTCSCSTGLTSGVCVLPAKEKLVMVPSWYRSRSHMYTALIFSAWEGNWEPSSFQLL